MKFLGSRESLALFGMPFGSAAVAYSSVQPPPFAASTSGSGSSGQLGDNANVAGDDQRDDQLSAEHGQETTDESIAPADAGASQVVEEALSEEPSSAKSEVTPGIPIRTETTPIDDRGRRKSILSAEFYETAETTSPGNTGGMMGESGPEDSSRMAIPTTVIREPSPGPPTPPPTPPRQFLHIADGDTKNLTTGPL